MKLPARSSGREGFRLFRKPPFVAFISSRFLFGTASKSLQATFFYQAFQLTGDELSLAKIGAVQFGPALLLCLVGGAVADAYDRRRIAQWAQVAIALVGIWVWWLSDTQQMTIDWLLVAAGAASVAESFERPARTALLPQLVSTEEFRNAVVVSSAVVTAAFMTGPLVAGFALTVGGAALSYAIFVGLVLSSIVLLSFVRMLESVPPRTKFSLKAIGEGLQFVFRQPVVFGCMTLDLFAVIFGGAVALLPVYTEEILGVGPRGYGILSASAEVGAVLMALYLLTRRPIRRSGRTLLGGVFVYGLATILFGVSRLFWLSLIAYTLVGMADYLSVVLRSTLVQLSTPEEIRGRVSAVNMLFIASSNQLATVESGVVAAIFSPTVAVVSGGIGAIVVVILVAVLVPSLRKHRLDE